MDQTVSRPRGERSRSSSPPSSGEHYGAKRELLFRRFAATIPLKRMVTVFFGDIRRRGTGETLLITGVPHLVLQDVIYLKVGASTLQGIPKGLITDIQGAAMSVFPAYGPSLAPTDPKFERFETAIMLEERVRLTWLEELRPDPATAALGSHISTTSEGVACMIDESWVHIAMVAENGKTVVTGGGSFGASWKQAIPRHSVLDIVFLGPRPVETASMPEPA